MKRPESAWLSSRHFIATGLAAASLPLIPSLLAASAAATPQLVVFDRRFAAARDFHRSMAVQGVAAIGIDGDITALWLEQLEPA